MKSRLASFLLGVSLAVAAPARAQPGGGVTFQAHLDAGIKLYQKEMFADAAVELEAAYKMEARPDVAFALAQSLRQSGDCTRALAYYRQLLAGELSTARRSAIEEAMVPCVAAEAASERNKPESEPGPTPSAIETEGPVEDSGGASVDVEKPSDDGPRRWYKDPLGTSLVVAGTAGVAVGIAGLVKMKALFAEAEGGTEKTFGPIKAEGQKWQIIGWTSLGIGTALAAGGVYRWMKVAERSEEAEGELTLLVDPSGGLIVAGEF
jgi:hypothetical protein